MIVANKTFMFKVYPIEARRPKYIILLLGNFYRTGISTVTTRSVWNTGVIKNLICGDSLCGFNHMFRIHWLTINSTLANIFNRLVKTIFHENCFLKHNWDMWFKMRKPWSMKIFKECACLLEVNSFCHFPRFYQWKESPLVISQWDFIKFHYTLMY